MEIKDCSFVKSVVDYKTRPEPALPEFAFAGRSNVGKSSLINSLLRRKNIAKISKQPGKTRTINYFLVNQSFYFVDLPGYGFAKVSQQEKVKWGKMIEDYLVNSRELRTLFVLVDALVGPKKNDEQLVEWLQFHQIPFTLIATKADKVGVSSQRKRAEEIGKMLNLSVSRDIFFYSAKKNTGRDKLLGQIELYLKNKR
ncbi:hypothetical protein B1H10_04640 [candidate division KSB1 bacterium 4484_188]|nr:MAG: hypothetical protein B1H10_04640 [candidate division KSB1 bacterium 4484_188]